MGVTAWTLAGALVLAPISVVARDVPPAPPVLTPLVRASMPMPGERDVALELVTIGPRAMLRATGRGRGVRSIETVADVLGLLGDARLAPLWPALLAWAGPDLTLLRDRRIAMTRNAVDGGEAGFSAIRIAESVVRGRARAVMQHAAALAEGGRFVDAAQMLERERDATPRVDAFRTTEWVMMSIRLAALRQGGGDLDGAIEGLARDRAVLGDSPYAINLDVNRAAFLAEAGRHAEALALVDQALAAFGEKRTRRDRVAGSNREFGWIRACALHGLGRADEARRALAPVLRAGEPVDRDWSVTSSDSIRFRAAACMGDVDGAARTLGQSIAVSPVAISTLLQPALRATRYRDGFLAAVRGHPAVVMAATDRVRPLPAEFAPALNGWRTP